MKVKFEAIKKYIKKCPDRMNKMCLNLLQIISIILRFFPKQFYSETQIEKVLKQMKM